MKATPLISSTFASAVVFLFLKLAVMAMANFPLNSLRRKPVYTEPYECSGGLGFSKSNVRLHFYRHTQLELVWLGVEQGPVQYLAEYSGVHLLQ